MRKMRVGFLMLSLTVMWVAGARAQAPTGADLAAKANAAYSAKDWTEAARLYEQLANAEPENTRYWFRLGASAQSIGQHKKAL